MSCLAFSEDFEALKLARHLKYFDMTKPAPNMDLGWGLGRLHIKGQVAQGSTLKRFHIPKASHRRSTLKRLQVWERVVFNSALRSAQLLATSGWLPA